ncbi:selenide, water dikinase [Thermogemmatispora aurantia]|jgi:selenide,water dikinase|uniref:Selenide, water dikinase n=2 Tax=Thermogemmatispora aurantia TaxID=2045279 RepID=A0A5J4JUR5_9CHLR|nr:MULTISPECIES: selenide, water dikinase SelD [Thermogemmatispora]GER81528.1 selenide, water dikinase [Thermogemmatispora aurantia]
MGPEALAQVLRPLKAQSVPPSLLVGLSAADDAAVYQINEQQAIISTADFFPPVVDDPYAFGAIAAANAMSDVYAMGGEVLMAINLVAWPDDLEMELLSEILRGGAETVARAQAVIAGGHTVSDREPKYGLAVTGSVHPQRIFTKGGAQPGDLLVLSKPLGTGLITTAHKRDQVTEEDLAAAVASMTRLNREASRALAELAATSGGVHAVTDVTGFGLLGHAWEMASQSLTSMRLTFSALPLLPHAAEYAARGCTPGGTSRNRAYFGPHVRLSQELDAVAEAILWDPQTSGGLLAAIAPELWPRLAALESSTPFWLIGEVTTRHTEEAQVSLEVY